MARVWSYRVGAWSTTAGTGWSHNIQMTAGLAALATALGAAGLGGRVSHLAIVAHGDAPGQVILDRTMTASVLPGFAAELRGLGTYLTLDGMLSFYACLAGKDAEGTALLTGISRELPGRTIVGFELYGLIGAPGQGLNRPGIMEATTAADPAMAVLPGATVGYLDPWCPFAKRALNGNLVHLPVLEQNVRPNRTCANPACGGHGSPYDACTGW